MLTDFDLDATICRTKQEVNNAEYGFPKPTAPSHNI